MVRNTLILLMLVIGGCAAFTSKSPSAELALKLKEGQSFKMKSKQVQDITTEVMGQKQEMHQETEIYYTVTVTDVSNDDIYSVDYTYDRVILKHEMPSRGMNTVYDSDKPTEVMDPTAQGYSRLIGKSLKAKINSEGKYIELKGMDEIWDETVENMGNIPHTFKEQVKEQMKSNYGDETLQQAFSSSSAVYPETRVEVGDSWTKETRVKVGIDLLMNSTYKLEQAKDGIYTINFEGNIKSMPGLVTLAPGVTADYNLTGPISGTLNIDQESGWVNSYRITQEISGNMKIQGDAIGNMEAPMSTKGITTIERLK